MQKQISMDIVDNELKAHIYQEVALLEPQLGAGSQVAVFLRHESHSPQGKDREAETFVVDLQVELGGEKLQVEAENTTPYTAMTAARQYMQGVLAEVMSLGELGAKRQTMIQSIINNQLLH